MKLCFAALLASALSLHGLLALAADPATNDRATVIVVVGAAGTSEYESTFNQWVQEWRELAEKANASMTTIADDTADQQRTAMESAVREQSALASNEPLWIVLLGHGTFDGKQAKFNLRGPDVSAEDLATWIKDCQRPLVIVNCSSSSGPFVNVLTGPKRVLVAATKSGLEVNYSRFGEHFIKALADSSSDLDKDDQVSVLEAYISAAGRVAEFYRGEGRLATEHSILDDNGDGLGTPGDWFRGVRAIRSARDGAALDGLLARQTHLLRTQQELQLSSEQRAERDRLEQEIEQLRGKKSHLREDEYYQQLEALMVELAKIYEVQ
jgi:hypothetical protein